MRLPKQVHAPQATILIVEDDEAIASILAKALRREGYDVALAADGQAAVDLLDQRRGGVDLLLLDILMPGMDGLQVLRHVRKMPSRVVCIVMTAWTSRWPDCLLMEAGADALLAKPFDLDAVIAAVARHLNRPLRATA